ncbi:hypothetical protein GO013_14645 [Pseudodesulfovibrio sp. JC047]|uniref:hypothetical protein n=1 Tax=Pseudodesulfovibrio sp. JC047 TaxID=2683199 RepID=UPI0013D5501D|nr:hypothetical protein [Pseudodesulfovibrio sp. JC047]NDV20647.1 hypothetical protein [Pseudodesulfovibrio sp. JC047]
MRVLFVQQFPDLRSATFARLLHGTGCQTDLFHLIPGPASVAPEVMTAPFAQCHAPEDIHDLAAIAGRYDCLICRQPAGELAGLCRSLSIPCLFDCIEHGTPVPSATTNRLFSSQMADTQPTDTVLPTGILVSDLPPGPLFPAKTEARHPSIRIPLLFGVLEDQIPRWIIDECAAANISLIPLHIHGSTHPEWTRVTDIVTELGTSSAVLLPLGWTPSDGRLALALAAGQPVLSVDNNTASIQGVTLVEPGTLLASFKAVCAMREAQNIRDLAPPLDQKASQLTHLCHRLAKKTFHHTHTDSRRTKVSPSQTAENQTESPQSARLESSSLATTAMDLAFTAFNAPIFDSNLGFWRRAMHLSSGLTDQRPHYYYGLCNLYAIVEAKRLLPELTKWDAQLTQAAHWLNAELKGRTQLGYDSHEVTTNLDQYSCALLPATLCAGYDLLHDTDVLNTAQKVYATYRDRFPIGQKQGVQASNHAILSALALHEHTDDRRYLDDAKQEGRFLMDHCRLPHGPAAGTFTDDGHITGFSRHCYGAWAMMALNEHTPSHEYVDCAATSLRWWRGVQRPSGLLPFFYDAEKGYWIDTTTYAVHQKGMLLLSAWDIAAHRPDEFESMIERAMAACDTATWRYRSPAGWTAFRRSNRHPDILYSYELGWQILGLAKGHARRAAA